MTENMQADSVQRPVRRLLRRSLFGIALKRLFGYMSAEPQYRQYLQRMTDIKDHGVIYRGLQINDPIVFCRVALRKQDLRKLIR